jgi:cell division protein FtsL
MTTDNKIRKGQEKDDMQVDEQANGRFKKPDNWFLVLFIAILAVPYVWFSHKTDRKIRELDKLNKSVKELRSEYVTLKSEIVSKNKQSDIVEKLEDTELKPLESAPYIIEKDK